MPYAALLHSHVTSWGVALILFVIALVLLSSGKMKGLKIVHMILRLFFILILITGISLLFYINFPISFIIKGLLAIWLIYTMEMILGKGAKGMLDGRMKVSFGVQF